MNIKTIGGGPGGLYASLLLKKRHPDWDVTVYERNPPDVTYGWGIVFPNRTMSNLEAADGPSHDAIVANHERWDPFDIFYHGERYRCGGNAFASMMRTDLLRILQERCREVGVDLQFETHIENPGKLASESDLCIFADGIHSRSRDRFADDFGTQAVTGEARFSWFGTDQDFDALTHIFVENDDGIWCAHTYPSPTTTFIIDCDAETWKRSGVGSMSEPEYLAYLENVFSEYLGDNSLLSQQDRWRQFETITNENWYHDNMVLLGDAAHTAHYSIGSGTTLAMEDAIGLMESFETASDVESALEEYERSRQGFVSKLLSAAERSRVHFDHIRRYYDLPPRQFAIHHLTRSGRLTYASLADRDPSFIEGFDEWFASYTPGESSVREPVFQPVELADQILSTRLARYMEPSFTATHGSPSSLQRTAFSDAASRGGGLLLTEPLAVAQAGRRTSGSLGLYADEHESAWAELIERTPEDTVAGARLYHAGRHAAQEPSFAGTCRSGAREPTWAPRVTDEFPVRPDQFRADVLDDDDCAAVVSAFTEAAARAAEAGFRYLHIDLDPDSLLGECLTRSDDASVSTDGTRLPIETLESVSAVWPDSYPLSASLPVSDNASTGFGTDEALDVAAAFEAAGCDVIAPIRTDTDPPGINEKGTSDYSDDIRNGVGVSTLATAAAGSIDKANTLVATGRADLCVFPRPVESP